MEKYGQIIIILFFTSGAHAIVHTARSQITTLDTPPLSTVTKQCDSQLSKQLDPICKLSQ